MSEHNRDTVIVMDESVFDSIAKDIVTFGMFAGLLWLNHAYLSGSVLVDAMFIIIVILFLTGRASRSVHKFYSKQEAISYLEGALDRTDYEMDEDAKRRNEELRKLLVSTEVEEAYKEGYIKGGLDTVTDMRRTK